MSSTNSEVNERNGQEEVPTLAQASIISGNIEGVSKMKVVELRVELSRRNLPIHGKKQNLITRLQAALVLERDSEASENVEAWSRMNSAETTV